jgi:NADP-dependent 3-hydroxy acid dehydrogenase YdfG
MLPFMIENKSGHIVNLGSVAGRWVYPGGGVYCATKYAVRALSEGLRMDLNGTGIRVTNIEPGRVETEFSIVRMGDVKKAKAVYEGMEPLIAKDIAECIVWSLQRPKHVNIQEMVVYPTDQAAIALFNKK